ncbi:hypothetical protein KAU39_02545 [bacterium]|nr:hypothetical protein [bacterium]
MKRIIFLLLILQLLNFGCAKKEGKDITKKSTLRNAFLLEAKGEYSKAIEKFKKVSPNDEKYNKAQESIARCEKKIIEAKEQSKIIQKKEKEVVEKVYFKQVGYYKKKLPNGSNKRVFSVYTPSNNGEAMKQYGRKQMYSAGGTTSVFFFNNLDNTPDVTFVAENFDKNYKKYWIALYVKGTTGKESLTNNKGQLITE